MGKPTNSTEEWKMRNLRDRLQKKSQTMPNGCIEWTGWRNRRGYGDTNFGGRVHLPTHRAAYALANGLHPTFKGGVIRHTCDNPACMNPEHLLLGTMGENNADRMSRDRQVRGANLPQAKLTEDLVVKIRMDARSQQKIAEAYGVNQTTIGRIKSRRIWTHV